MPERHRERIPAYAGLAAFQARLTDASVHDDERVGQGYDELKRLGYFWVAVRVRAAFHRLPDGAAIEIETWANPPGTAAIERCYRLSDAQGVFAVGRARWALVRLSDGGPVRLASVPWLVAPRSFEAENPFPDGYLSFPAPATGPVSTIRVPASGIDRNGHLNNARYWDLVFAAAAACGLPHGDVAEIEIGYHKAVFAGDAVAVRLSDDGDRIGFSGRIDRDGSTVLAFSGFYRPR